MNVSEWREVLESVGMERCYSLYKLDNSSDNTKIVVV